MQLAELLEGRGESVLRVADYVSKVQAPDVVKAEMKKLASELIKRGFFAPEVGNLRLNDDGEPSGFGYSFIFPLPKDKPYLQTGILTVLYTAFDEDDMINVVFKKSQANYSAREILEMGLDKFLQHVKSLAEPVK